MNKQKSKQYLIATLFVYVSLSHSLSLSSFLHSDTAKTNNPNPSGIVFRNEPEPFRRSERNRGIDQKPFKFPIISTISDNSRRVRWPHERHSSNALDLSAAINPLSIIVFPRSQTKTKSDNELPMVINTEIVQPIKANALQSTESNETTTVQNTVPFVLNSINTNAFILNKTAIQNGLMPMIYIDDDGIFQVKYIPKGENVSISNADQQQQNSTSINKTEEIAIISNDNRQILLDQHIHTVTTVMNSATPAPTQIDLIQDHTINNIKPADEQYEEHTESTSFRPVQQQKQQQQQHQPNQLSDDKHPTLYNELPIFA